MVNSKIRLCVIVLLVEYNNVIEANNEGRGVHPEDEPSRLCELKPVMSYERVGGK
jgi:hypothetical protein